MEDEGCAYLPDYDDADLDATLAEMESAAGGGASSAAGGSAEGGSWGPYGPPPVLRRSETFNPATFVPGTEAGGAGLGTATPQGISPPGQFIGPGSGFQYRMAPRTSAIPTAPINPPEPDADGEPTDPADFEATNPAFSASTPVPKKGSRRWVFTLNGPSRAEEEALSHFFEQKCIWAIMGREFVTRSHLQGGFRMKDTKTLSALKKIPCFAHCWLAPARGTELHVRSYCVKQGDWVEWHAENFSPGQGARTDIQQMVSLVRDQGEAGLAELISQDPLTFVRYHGGLEKLVLRFQKPRRLATPPEVIWYMGPSNSGKTYQANLAATAAAVAMATDVYEANLGNFPWWPGLKSQRVCMINEFRATNSRASKIPLDTWCKMWDVLGFNCEVKGGNVEMQCSKFYVTCVSHPSEIYPDTAAEPNVQFLRRITKVIRCRRHPGVEGQADTFSQEDLGPGTAPLMASALAAISDD